MKPTEETEKQFKYLFDKLSTFIYKHAVQKEIDDNIFISAYIQSLISYMLMIYSEDKHEENKKIIIKYISEIYDEQLKKWRELKNDH